VSVVKTRFEAFDQRGRRPTTIGTLVEIGKTEGMKGMVLTERYVTASSLNRSGLRTLSRFGPDVVKRRPLFKLKLWNIH
jgi:hypothetical protein